MSEPHSFLSASVKCLGGPPERDSGYHWSAAGEACVLVMVCAGSLLCMDPPVREEDEGDLSEGGGLQSNPLSSYRHHYAR